MTRTEAFPGDRVADVLRHATALLAAGSKTARADSEILLCHLLGKSRTWLFAHPEEELSAEILALFTHLIQARSRGFPVAYLTGTREFWSLDLQVNEATLIPRPDTELLVEATLQRLDAIPNARVLDMGTGSGAIVLALAREREDLELSACDISEAALQCAISNAQRLQLSRVAFYPSDWFSGLPAARFDAIVSNPPYLAADDPHLLQGDVRFEPESALVSGSTGLEAFQQIAKTAPAWLNPGGWLLFEHGWTQGPEVRNILQQAGFETVETLRDIEARERVSVGRICP